MEIKKAKSRNVAFVACRENCGNCLYGCLGCDICKEACKFNAITTDQGIASVDQNVCIGCGLCAQCCPQHVIQMRSRGQDIMVQCSNHNAGKTAREVCINSCVGCGLCERSCPADAIRVIDQCAQIEQEHCLDCGMCVTICPRKTIVDLRGILT